MWETIREVDVLLDIIRPKGSFIRIISHEGIRLLHCMYYKVWLSSMNGYMSSMETDVILTLLPHSLSADWLWLCYRCSGSATGSGSGFLFTGGRFLVFRESCSCCCCDITFTVRACLIVMHHPSMQDAVSMSVLLRQPALSCS